MIQDCPRCGGLDSKGEPKFFWIPNSVVDDKFITLGPMAIMIYLVLSRASTLDNYPSVKDLSLVYNIGSTAAIRLAIELLHKEGLLEEHDLMCIDGLKK